MAAVQSVVRSIALLGEVANKPRGLVGLAEAARLPTSTAARLLSTLADVDALRRDDDGVYRIGPAITSMVATGDVAPSLRGLAHPHMVELVAAVDEAVGLSIQVDDETVTIAQVDAPRPVQAEDWYGTRWSLFGGGSGFALLATWPDAQIERVLQGAPDPDRVRAGVAEARRTGVSWSHGDYVDELSSVASAIVDRTGGAVGALYVYGPSYRFPTEDTVADVEWHLRDAAGRISRAWIGRTAPEGRP
ncbi:MAG TPA: IclR family transcriptional regulator [Euzebyales bacterium]|nr:IclR family transcriptional regulator [Euzebyales bacterium]